MKRATASAKQFLALARVSSREQAREGFSLDVQEDALRRYAATAGGEILKLWRIAETATRSQERKTFKEMVVFAKKHAHRLDGLLFYKIDRAVRNLYDLVELERLESEYDVPFISISQPTENNPAGRMMRRTLANMASFYTEQQSLDVREGMQRRVEVGWFPSRAWYGYRNHRGVDGRSVVVVEESEADNVRRIFALAETGSCTIEGIIQRLHAEGRTYRSKKPSFGVSQVHCILRTPIYCGLIPYKGVLYEGKHTPLITKSVYDRVQTIIRRRTNLRDKPLKQYLYRGLFNCGGCGCVMTIETQKGHNYLRCTRKIQRDCRNPYVREELVTNRIADTLRSVALPRADADWLIEELERRQQNDEAERLSLDRRLTDSLGEAHKRLERLAELYVAEGLKIDEYASVRNRLMAEKHRLKEQIDALRTNSANRLEPAIRFVNASKEAGFVAEHGTDEEKRDLFKTTGSNLQLLNREIRWAPRDAWQIVHETLADHGSLAHNNEAACGAQAASLSCETRHHLASPAKWAILDSNQ